jgi:type I restriction enzyme R subunit
MLAPCKFAILYLEKWQQYKGPLKDVSQLVNFTENLKAEDERHIKEGLTKDELELFDIPRRDKLTKAEEIKVKNAARHLLNRLRVEKQPVLIQDWYKDSQSQLRVKTVVEEILDSDLPETYDKNMFKEKSSKIYELIYDHAVKGLNWVA